MRVLVTGSSGFLGRQVAEHLGLDGFDVTGFDLRPDPHGSIRTIIGDLCDPSAVKRACRSVDAVAHLGGVGDVDLATRRPEVATSANVVGTTNVALGAMDAGASVIYASTWEVYGPPQQDPVVEHHPRNPGHFYGATKLAGEQMLKAAEHSGDLFTVILRLGTAYGPGMRANAVFCRFADEARARRPIVVHGDGSQWRQFTHTSDICRAFRLACKTDVAGAVLNIAAEEMVTVRRLAELVSERYGVPISFVSARHGDPQSARISSAEASRVLGWHAEVTFEDGLDALLASGDGERAMSANGSLAVASSQVEPTRY